MAMARWHMVWTNYDTVPVGEIDAATDRKFTFRLNAPNTIEFKVPMTSAIGKKIAAAPYGFGLVKLYRNGVLQMVAETTSLQIVGKQGERSVGIVATEAAYPRLAARLAVVTGPEPVPPTSSTAAAQAFSDRLSYLGIHISTLTTGSVGSTSAILPSVFDVGTSVLDLLHALAFRGSGFDFWFNPIEPVAPTPFTAAMAQFNAASIKGTTKPSASFEFGKDTRANVDEYTYTALSGDHLVNTMVASGPSSSAEAPTAASWAIATDGTALSIFGDRTRLINSDIELKALRQDLANLHVAKRAYPRKMFTMKPSVSYGDGSVPQFITDYDIGDIVPAIVKDEGTTILNASVRVYGVIISPDSSGKEDIELELNPDTTA